MCVCAYSYTSTHIQGGKGSKDALSCRSFSAKDLLIIGPFCGKWPIQDKACYDSTPPCTQHLTSAILILVCIHINAYIHMYIHLCMHIYMFQYAYLQHFSRAIWLSCVHILHICTYIYACIRVYICMYTRIHVYLYTCINLNTHIYSLIHFDTFTFAHDSIRVMVHSNMCHDSFTCVTWLINLNTHIYSHLTSAIWPPSSSLLVCVWERIGVGCSVSQRVAVYCSFVAACCGVLQSFDVSFLTY